MPGTAPWLSTKRAMRARGSTWSPLHSRISPEEMRLSRVTARRLDYDESHPARGAAAEMQEVPVIGYALMRRILAHRRHGDAVAEGDLADGQRTQEIDLGHASVMLGPCPAARPDQEREADLGIVSLASRSSHLAFFHAASPIIGLDGETRKGAIGCRDVLARSRFR